MLHIVCVNRGNYLGRGEEYVLKLQDMVKRNLPEGLEGDFICFTDKAIEGVTCAPLPDGIDGWFNKLYLFKSELFPPGDRIIYFDLDTVITGPLDDIVKYDGDFAILRDFYRADGYGSGVMAWKADVNSHIWDEYQSIGCPDIEGGDQAWIEQVVPKADILQDVFPTKFVSYKVSCRNIFPKSARVVCFHGTPRPHEAGGWVDHIWKIGGGSSLELMNVGNTSDEVLIDQIKQSMKLPYLWVEQKPAHDEHAIIVGGAPSLKKNLEEIRWRQSQGQKIFSTNNTFKFLKENGIIADFHVMLDARPENVEFVADAGICYYASQCHPSVFAKAKNVIIWHPLSDGINEVLGDDPRQTTFVGGGSTVGLKSMSLAYILGYRNLHIYGMDSSYSESEGHAYKQKLNENERVLDVVFHDVNFRAAPWMISQVEEFQELAPQLVNMGCVLTIHGDGLLPFAASKMEEGYDLNSLHWPEHDVHCRASLKNVVEEVNKVVSFVDEKKVVIQAGGNVGVWPKVLSGHFSKVYTFEPDSENYSCLEKNCTEDNITHFNAALGEKESTIGIVKKQGNCGAHHVSGEGEIPVMTIDSLDLEGCDLIQLDIEGYELYALKGAENTIDKYNPVICIEENGLSERNGIPRGSTEKYLLEKGYVIADRMNRDIIFTKEK